MSGTGLWVIDRTNQRGDEVLERNVAGRIPRWLAEETVHWYLWVWPERHYAIREEKEGERT